MASLLSTLACADDVSSESGETDEAADEVGVGETDTTSESESESEESESEESESEESESEESESSESEESESESESESSESEESESSDTGTGGQGDECPPEVELPYDGPLCGPPELPCQLVAEQELHPPEVGHSLPAIALGGCQPHVLFGFSNWGFYATDDGGGWSVEEMGAPMFRGGLVVDPLTQEPTALLDHWPSMVLDILDGVTTWVRDGDWQQVAELPGYRFNHGVARDLDGTIHAGLHIIGSGLQYGVWDGLEWDASSASGTGSQVNLAISAAGEVQLTAWSTDNGTHQILWQVPGEPVEVAADYGSNSLDEHTHALAVTGGDADEPAGTAHMIHAVTGGELAYTVRNGPDDWSTVTFAPGEDFETCDASPVRSGQQCAYHYIRHHPLSIVASHGGDVRLLWGRIDYAGTYLSVCGMGEPDCQWVLEEDTTSGSLWVGWPAGDTIEGVEVAASFGVETTAAVDPGGHIHIALLDEPPGIDSPSSIRYIRLAP